MRDKATALANIPVGKMLQVEGETALKFLQDGRRRHGRLLERTGQIAGLTKKEVAAAIAVTQPQLSGWIAGDPDAGQPQTWRFQQHPVLKKALLIAQAEEVTGTLPVVGFRVPLDFRKEEIG